MSRPRIRHLRHRRLGRQRYGRMPGFLAEEALRLAPTATDRVVASVTPASNQIAITGHGLTSGDGPFNMATDDTLPAGLDAATSYYVSVVSANDLTLHLTARDAADGDSAVGITDGGTGNHTMVAASSIVGIFGFMKQGGFSSETLRAETDIDDLI